MKITVLGNGSFTIDKEHSGPGYLLQTGKANILVDCGPGVMSQMAEIGFDPVDLDYIFITHKHSDHVSDLFPLLARIAITEVFYGKKFEKELTIYGSDIKEYVHGIANLVNSGTVKNFQKFVYKEIGEKLNIDGLDVEPHKVEHVSDLNCYAYKITYLDKTVTFSGDTNLNKGIIDATKEIDLLIADCGVPKGGSTKSHMSSEEVGKLCSENKVRKVVLSHILPPAYNKDLVAEVKEVYDGEVVLAEKLMEIEL